MKYVWVVTMESTKFSWIAVGNTRKEALTALKDRWDRWIFSIPEKQRGGALTWNQFKKQWGNTPDNHFDTRVQKLMLGRGYMDHDKDES